MYLTTATSDTKIINDTASIKAAIMIRVIDFLYNVATSDGRSGSLASTGTAGVTNFTFGLRLNIISASFSRRLC